MPKPTPTSAYGVILSAAASDAGEPLGRVMLLPMGEINARDGRKWRLDDRAHAEAVVAASLQRAGSTDLPFDYDHQTVFGAKDGVGGKAPASGWIKGLRVQDDGIWADVDWTAAAAAQMKAKEYRYVSPYFFHERDTGRITRIGSAALTNTPAITELPAVASDAGGDPNPQGTSMTLLEQLRKAYGLPATATEAEILAAANTRVEAAAAASVTALAPIATALGLTDKATSAEVAAAASAAVAGKADPTKFVPIDIVTNLQAQVKALTDGQAEAAASTAIAAAIEEGKIAPAQKDWATSYAKADLAGFKAFVAAAPAIVNVQGAPASTRQPVNAAGELVVTPEIAAAASMVGVSPEAFLATRKAEMEASV